MCCAQILWLGIGSCCLCVFLACFADLCVLIGEFVTVLCASVLVKTVGSPPYLSCRLYFYREESWPPRVRVCLEKGRKKIGFRYRQLVTACNGLYCIFGQFLDIKNKKIKDPK